MSFHAKRLAGLDALRGIAAMTVVLGHFTVAYATVTGHPHQPSITVPDGHYGVELFFIISGFVIFMTLDRTRHPYDFVASRVARLWPAYLACMALTVLVTMALRLPWQPTFGPRLIAVNTTMVPALFDYPAADPSYWTLAFELSFYVLAATAVFKLGARYTEHCCLGWLALCLAGHLYGFEQIDDRIEILTAMEFAPLFVIGVMLYRARAEQGGRAPYALIALSLALCAYGPHWSYRPIHAALYIAMVATFALLVWLGTQQDSFLGRIRPLVFLGEISYSLYLVHQVIGFAFMERLGALGVGPNTLVVAATALAVLIALGVNRLLERPGQRMIRAAFDRHRARAVRVSTV